MLFSGEMVRFSGYLIAQGSSTGAPDEIKKINI